MDAQYQPHSRVPIRSVLAVVMVLTFALASSLSMPGLALAQDYEAEDAFLSPGFVVATNHSGFSGSGFVDYRGEGYVEWTFDVPEGGSFILSFRYALENGDRPLDIVVNGTVASPNTSFPATGAWENWDVVETGVTLNTGSNTVRAQTLGVSGANMDLLNLQKRFIDNRDGTISDNLTNLMWEKKNAADGVQDYDNPHDVDNGYAWSSGSDPDGPGPVFTNFLARLNNTASDSSIDRPFADYTDWRIPTVWELKTLLIEQDNDIQNPCSVMPCIDPIFEPFGDRRSFTWTSSTSRDDVRGCCAWSINIYAGFPIDFSKVNSSIRVRAVRGGRGR